MNPALEQSSRRLDTPPWEPFGGFYGSGAGAAPFRQVIYGVRPLRGAIEAKSGLTRRGLIYEYIRRHPGAHVRGMAKDLGLATGGLQYHLLWLERHGFVKTKKGSFYRFVFPTMVFGDEQEVILGVLSQETPREMLLSLLHDPSITQGELARSLGFSQPTISWHMDRLVELGLVRKRRTGKGMVYEVAADRGEVLGFVKSYHPEVWKRWAGRLGDATASAALERIGEEGPRKGVRLVSPAVVELIGKR